MRQICFRHGSPEDLSLKWQPQQVCWNSQSWPLQMMCYYLLWYPSKTHWVVVLWILLILFFFFFEDWHNIFSLQFHGTSPVLQGNRQRFCKYISEFLDYPRIRCNSSVPEDWWKDLLYDLLFTFQLSGTMASEWDQLLLKKYWVLVTLYTDVSSWGVLSKEVLKGFYKDHRQANVCLLSHENKKI